MCFDITCSCVDAGKDTCTSLNTSTDRSTRLRTSDACPYCMLLNPRINVEKNKLEEQNVTQKSTTMNIKEGRGVYLCKLKLITCVPFPVKS